MAISEEELKLSKLFDPETGIQGKSFKIPPSTEKIDAIIPLNPEIVDKFPHFPLAALPNLPPQIRRVWIYETEPVNAVTMVLRLQSKNTPLRLYQLYNPLTSIQIRKKYDRLPPNKPRYAPSWITRDYGTHLSLIKKYNIKTADATR